MRKNKKKTVGCYLFIQTMLYLISIWHERRSQGASVGCLDIAIESMSRKWFCEETNFSFSKSKHKLEIIWHEHGPKMNTIFIVLC